VLFIIYDGDDAAFICSEENYVVDSAGRAMDGCENGLERSRLLAPVTHYSAFFLRKLPEKHNDERKIYFHPLHCLAETWRF
jgi:hypothetical protein